MWTFSETHTRKPRRIRVLARHRKEPIPVLCVNRGGIMMLKPRAKTNAARAHLHIEYKGIDLIEVEIRRVVTIDWGD